MKDFGTQRDLSQATPAPGLENRKPKAQESSKSTADGVVADQQSDTREKMKKTYNSNVTRDPGYEKMTGSASDADLKVISDGKDPILDL